MKVQEIHANRFFAEVGEDFYTDIKADNLPDIVDDDLPKTWNGGFRTIEITGEDVRHIRDVLRMKAGDSLVVCDGRGNDWLCRIAEIKKTGVLTEVLGRRQSSGEPPVEVVLYQGMPRGDKFDLVVQKCVEVGVSRIVPMICERTQFGAELLKKANKTDRWRRIALEAAKQSGRGKVPKIADVVTLENAVRLLPEGAFVIIPYEKERERTLKSTLREHPEAKNCHIFIGPEGGFSEREIAGAIEAGAMPVTLGPRILRTETAGIVVIATVLYELDH